MAGDSGPGSLASRNPHSGFPEFVCILSLAVAKLGQVPVNILTWSDSRASLANLDREKGKLAGAAIISCQTSWPRENGMYVNRSINTKNDVFVFDLVKLWFSGILDSINPL